LLELNRELLGIAGHPPIAFPGIAEWNCWTPTNCLSGNDELLDTHQLPFRSTQTGFSGSESGSDPSVTE
jgi:hypothetical protein